MKFLTVQQGDFVLLDAVAVGDIALLLTPQPGFLLCNGGTIGPQGSGATARANQDTKQLWELLWGVNALQMFTAGGEPTARGIRAIDWSADRAIALPDIPPTGAVSTWIRYTLNPGQELTPELPSPVRIEAESYIYFFDTTTGNAGGAGSRNDDVDIYATSDPTGNALTIGNTNAGEYLVYSVTIPATGQWALSARVASAIGGSLNVKIGTAQYGDFGISNTGGWENWQTLNKDSQRLVAGVYEMVCYVNNGFFNLNWLEMTCSSVEQTSQPSQLPPAFRIQAEDFVAASDGTRTTNEGGAYRTPNTAANPFGVDIGTTGIGGSRNIGWTTTGEWTSYELIVPATGQYEILIPVSMQGGGTQLGISIDGTQIAALEVPNTGSWVSWQMLVISNVSLSRGAHVLRADWIVGGFDLDFFEFTCTALGV